MEMKTLDVIKAIRIFGLCILWYVISASNNIIGKLLLSGFPYPMTMTLVQLLSTAVLTAPLLKLRDVRKMNVSWRYWFKMILPLSIGKFVATVSAHISIWSVPVSYAHTGTCIWFIYN